MKVMKCQELEKSTDHENQPCRFPRGSKNKPHSMPKSSWQLFNSHKRWSQYTKYLCSYQRLGNYQVSLWLDNWIRLISWQSVGTLSKTALISLSPLKPPTTIGSTKIICPPLIPHKKLFPWCFFTHPIGSIPNLAATLKPQLLHFSQSTTDKPAATKIFLY